MSDSIQHYLPHVNWSFFLRSRRCCLKLTLMWFWPTSSLICRNKMPTRCNRGLYCRSYCLLNMFRAPLCPSSGAQEYYTVGAACGISCCKDVKSNFVRLFQITNLMHNPFILQQYVCYTTILNVFRAARCSSSGGQIVSPQPLVSSPLKLVNYHILIKWGLLFASYVEFVFSVLSVVCYLGLL